MKNILNRLKYPKTDAGRRRYIQDSLKPKYQIKLIFAILIVVGISGMVVTGLFICSFLLFILAMCIFLAGVQGLQPRDKPHSQNEQEIDEMIERKKRRENHD